MSTKADQAHGNGGRTYETILTVADLAELSLYFQQRLVLAHNNGAVDTAYRTNTGDNTYEAGQRLAIKPDDVRRMASLVEKLVEGLREDLP